MFDKILPRKTFVKGSRLLAGLWHCKISCLAKLLFQRVSLGLYQRNIDNKGVDDKKVNVRAVKQLKSPLRERRKCLESILLSVCAKETKMPNKKRENKRKSKVARFRSGRTHTRIDYGQTNMWTVVAHIQPELFSCSLTRKEIVYYLFTKYFRFFDGLCTSLKFRVRTDDGLR